MGSFSQGALIEQLTSTATSGSTTALTSSSTTWQRFTGTSIETVTLPDATTLKDGRYFIIENRSSGVLTVNFNGPTLAATIQSGSERTFNLYDNGSAAGDWAVGTQVDLDGPLSLFATRPTPDNFFNIGPNTATNSEEVTLSVPPLNDEIPAFAGATINFSTGSATAGTTGTIFTAGGAFTRPSVNDTEFVRMAIAYQTVSGSAQIDTLFSAASASQGALADPGSLFASLDGTPVGYIDLEAEGTGSFNFKTPGSVTTIINNTGIVKFGSGAGGSGAGGDTAFKVQSITSNVATVKKGFIILDDGRELVTYDGSSSNVDISFNLKTEVNSLGITSPGASTAYYLYIDLSFLPVSTVTVGNSDRVAYNVEKGTTNPFIIFAETPENVDAARYISPSGEQVASVNNHRCTVSRLNRDRVGSGAGC